MIRLACFEEVTEVTIRRTDRSVWGDGKSTYAAISVVQAKDGDYGFNKGNVTGIDEQFEALKRQVTYPFLCLLSGKAGS